MLVDRVSWLQLSVDVQQAQLDAVTSILDSAGALSVTLLDALDELLIEPVPGSSPMWKKVRVVALFPEGTDTLPLQQMIRDGFPDRQIDMRVESLADRDWSSTWRDTFNPMCFGTRLWVCPTNADCPAQDAVVVRLDPGAAFGTGTHATTALCLEWLDRHPPVGQTVVDYGCGSGILAIAASKLGAAQVVAVDIDLHAVDTTRDNAGANEITGHFTACLPDEFSCPPAHLLIANILANPLQELAAQLCSYLLPGGRILLTGILEHQASAVQEAYQPWIDFEVPVQRANGCCCRARSVLRAPELLFIPGEKILATESTEEHGKIKHYRSGKTDNNLQHGSPANRCFVFVQSGHHLAQYGTRFFPCSSVGSVAIIKGSDQARPGCAVCHSNLRIY
jgi:ribosomal protein L11 methyltransferase